MYAERHTARYTVIMVSQARILFLGVLCVFGVDGLDHKNRHYRDAIPGVSTPQTKTCDFSVLEARLQRLESRFEEKLDGVRRDIWSSSRNIEQQTVATKNAIEECRNEIKTHTERSHRNSQLQPKPAAQTSDLEREVQVAIATLRLLSSDLAIVRENLSDVASVTNAIKEQLQVDSSIKDIFKPSPSNLPATESKSVPSSCLDIKQSNYAASSSIFLVQPKGSKKPFLAYCDMDYQDGGWLTIQNRFLGEQDFYRDWQDYKVGFGNIAGEHWLGLEHIYELTGNDLHELLIQLVDVNNIKTFAHYSHFSIGSEEEGYALKVLGGFQGSAGDSLSYHAGSKFSTKDKDQDSWAEGHCAQSHSGAWWYKSCDKSNLNGRYLPGEQPDILLYQSMYWGSFSGPQTGLKYVRMMIRPKKGVSQTSTAMRL